MLKIGQMKDSEATRHKRVCKSYTNLFQEAASMQPKKNKSPLQLALSLNLKKDLNLFVFLGFNIQASLEL